MERQMNIATQTKRQNIVTLSFSIRDQEEVVLLKQMEEFTLKNCINRSEWIKSLIRKEFQRQAQSA